MADVINLRQQRKTKARTEKEKNADANRRLHGQTKTTRKKKELEASQAAKLLDGHKRTPDRKDDSDS
jgi:hypothetical protein